jgi:hypothetical protein
MTREEFKNTRFGNGMKVNYKGVIAKIVSVDFEEDLFGILLKDNEQEDDFELTWVRCESCALENKR